MNTAKRYFLLGLLLLVAVGTLTASEHRGIVKFGGIPLPGATVTATQDDKKLTAITDQQGVYSFADLPDGVWSIQVEMLCFAPVTKEVAVAPNAPSPEWELTLLPLAEMHASAAAAPPSTTAAPGSAAPATTTSATLTPEKPAANGNGANGAKPAKSKGKAAAAPTNPPGGFQRAEVNASSGANATSAEPPVADASNGASEAMIVNGSVSNGIERRAIGNARKGPGMLYRGDVMGVLDNSALNARQYSLTGQNTPQPAYNHLRAGFSFGGPLGIPHVLRSNGQFFLSYQLSRNRNASTQSTLMPTDAQRNGDFSNLVDAQGKLIPIIDPTNGKPFAGNIIPKERFSDQAVSLLKFYKEPNFIETAGYNYQVPLVSGADSDDAQGRINRTLSRKDFINGGFGYHNGRGQGPNIFDFIDGNDNSGMQANVTWRHMFNQRLNMTFSLQFSRFSQRNTPFFANKRNISGEVGITGNNQDAPNWGPPGLSFASGIATLSDVQNSFTRNQTAGFTYAGLWVHRPHNITYGADYRRQQFNLLSQTNPRGVFTFTGAAAGNDFAGFLLGIPDTSAVAFGNADKYFRSSMSDAWVTDDWRVAAGLTLNIGMRWEYGAPFIEKYGRLVNLDVLPGFTAVSPVVANNPTGSLTGQQYPDSLVRPDKHAFQPRISFSWHPLFGSTVVVRGGYGVYYNTSVYQAIAQQMMQQYPLSKTLSVQNGPLNQLTLANGFNYSPGVTPNTFAIDPDFRVGYSQNFQLSVQKDLTEGIVMTATYLGIKGTRGVQVFLPQTFAPSDPNACLRCPSGYAFMTSNGNSTRHAGTMQLVRRFHNGLSATLNYTFSKSLDNAALGGRGQGNQVIAQDWTNLRGERGLSIFDQRHLATFQMQYTTGVGVRGGTLLGGWRGVAFKGWTIASQITAGSGLPETPSVVSAVGRTGVTGPLRPDYNGQPVYDGPPGYSLNAAAFVVPVGHWGTAGRNIIIGPSQFSMNASMARTFQENLDIRLDAQNALNHVTFPSYNVIIGSPQFGLPTQANSMRTVQLTVRWRF